MPLPTVYFGPFNAEALWRDPAAAALPAVKDSQAQRIVAALDELQFVFCGEGDVLLTARELVPGHREYLSSLGFRFAHAVVPRDGGTGDRPLPGELADRLRGARPSPYAVVPGLEAECARYGLASGLPPLEVVRRVNSKTWSHGLALALGLFGAGRLVRSIDELASEGRRLLPRGSFIVKDPFGVSGKGALAIGSDLELEQLIRYLRKQVDQGRFIELLVQPIYERDVDFSCHFDVTDAGLRLHGLQVMENDGFAFSGVRTAPAELDRLLEHKGYGRVIEQLSQALGLEGYRGPVCVDSMLLRDGTLVPLLEINARKSMGRINHRLREWAGGGVQSHLRMLNLVFERGEVSFDQVLEALRHRGLLYEGARPGLLPLSGSAVVANLATPGDARARGAPRGRLYVAALAPDQRTATDLLDGLPACLESIGVDVMRRQHA